MVDLTPIVKEEHNDGESSKIKNFMGKTPGLLKSKFLSVLGNSNNILNDISNKLDITLSLSSSSASDGDFIDDDEEIENESGSVDVPTVDFESRRVKERRAHEEILSGKFRHPIPRIIQNGFLLNLKKKSSFDSDSSKSSTYSNSINSKSPHKNDTDLDEQCKDLNEVTPTTPEIYICSPSNSKLNGNLTLNTKKPSNSSTFTSLNDPGTSIESDLKLYLRSESENSVPSWASSISLDCCGDETIKEFIKNYVELLFTNSSSIGLELKSEFGQKARTEAGRLWFSRYVSAQRSKSKRVDETTFYSLIQYFAIILFECAESEDYSPAKNLMNMCFTFYHEIEVPGCEPYREYLFTYLRQQPIWHTLRFWNAAFFDALQCERAHRPVPKIRKIKKSKSKCDKNIYLSNQNDNDDDKGNSSGSSIIEDAASANELKEDQKFQQNITFGQLGTFTCNMHAFGLSKDLCLEFLKKQSTIANLPEDQEKLLRDNINRLYHETEKWGA